MMLRNPSSADNNVVILVDNKIRDLDGAALIAHHLRKAGVECHLEPLEAFRAVLAAYRPAMIVFNLITASHLVEWSRRLADMGVLTGVLLNEGIFYDPETLQFNVGRFHNGAHVDYYFCWNEGYRAALASEGFNRNTRAEVVGVHRFDLYFKPWSQFVDRPRVAATGRPKVLVCTNFICAHSHNLPPEQLDKQFAMWAARVPLYRNYRRSAEAHWRGRNRFFEYLEALVDADKFDITLRPHPLEVRDVYTNWIAALPREKQRSVHLDIDSNISGLILDTDLEISCETCTTAIESWIARRPTIELSFDGDPLWHHPVHSRANVVCDRPQDLPAMVEAQLCNPAQPEKAEIRRQHIKDWCGDSDGQVCSRIARIMAEAVRGKKPSDWSKLDLNDYRRAVKLKGTSKIGHAYHYDPFLPIKRFMFADRYFAKDGTYRKSIKPADAAAARARLDRLPQD